MDWHATWHILKFSLWFKYNNTNLFNICLFLVKPFVWSKIKTSKLLFAETTRSGPAWIGNFWPGTNVTKSGEHGAGEFQQPHYTETKRNSNWHFWRNTSSLTFVCWRLLCVVYGLIIFAALLTMYTDVVIT